jgi:hypothetical protein
MPRAIPADLQLQFPVSHTISTGDS